MSRCVYTPGDNVVLLTGTAPQVVLDTRYHCGQWQLRCAYVRWFSGGYEEHSRSWRRASDFEPYQGDPQYHDYENKKAYKMAAKLFQTLEETPRFGTYLARNSTGQIVLEMKPGGLPEAFDADKVVEVKPYTVRIRFRDGNYRHYSTTPNSVNVGDAILFKTLDFGVVDQLNSGYSNMVDELKGRRFLTEEI